MMNLRFAGLLLFISIFTFVNILSGQETTQSRQKTLYVSKLGHNTDGSSWIKAFSTIQAALDAIPDSSGGYRIIIRSDTYFEAMLFPAGNVPKKIIPTKPTMNRENPTHMPEARARKRTPNTTKAMSPMLGSIRLFPPQYLWPGMF